MEVKMKKLIDNISEITLLIGFGFIIYGSFLYNQLFGHYITGLIFIILALLLAKKS